MRYLLVFLMAICLAGCSGGDSVLPGSATGVPLFQPSRLQDYRPEKVEWVGSNKRETKEWVWKTTSPTADVLAFYQKALPGAKAVKSGKQTAFVWTGFPEADQDEAVTVTVQDDGIFRVAECLAPKKGKHRDEIVRLFPKDNDLPESFR